MKKILIGSVASLFMASALVAAQGASSTSPASPSEQSPSATTSASDTQKDKGMSLTGCLVQGESASQFVLEDARTAAQSSSEPGARYVLAKSGDVDFSKNLNHKVTVTGAVEAAPAGGASSAMGANPSSASSTSPSSSTSPEGQSPSSSTMGSPSSSSASASQAESTANLPTLNATNIVSISDSCTAE
jgi:hypothetical protein